MGKDVWWDWRSDWETRMEPDLTTDQQRMKALRELSSRCIILEDLPENVTPTAIESSLGQFGNVLGVKLLKGPVDQKFTGRAVVELKLVEEKFRVIKQLPRVLSNARRNASPGAHRGGHPDVADRSSMAEEPELGTGAHYSEVEPEPSLVSEQEMEKLVIRKQDDEQELYKRLRLDELLRERKQEEEAMETKETLDMILALQNDGSLDEVRKLHNVSDGLRQQNV